MDNKKQFYKVVSFLKREELEFLDDLIKDIYFSHGIKIPRAKLIEEIINAFKNKQDDQDRQAIEEELLRMFKQFKEKETEGESK